MLELLIASAFAAFPAAECPVALERREEMGLVLWLRPSCPIGYRSTHGAVRALLSHAGGTKEVSLGLGRLAGYPWLSTLLARQASSSRAWDHAAGKARGESDNSYVAAALRGMPEFTVLFDDWRIAAVSVEKVLVKPARELSLARGAPLPPDSLLPWDANVWVTLARP
ncbi:MAG: hypothetical protein ACT4P9_08385 [Betaproteobacteria bacterium]